MRGGKIGVIVLLWLTYLPSDGRSQPDQNPIRLYFNDAPYSPQAGEVLLKAGQPNRLGIKADSRLPGSRTLSCKVTRILPDGEKIRDEARLDGQTREVHLDLGPMAATPIYEFEAGVVYQRGYGLEVLLRDEKDRPILSWEFHQGLSAEASEKRQGMGEIDPSVKALRLLAGRKERIRFDPKFGALGPLSLRLGEPVLHDQDRLEIQARLNEGEGPAGLAGLLRITSPSGKGIWHKEIILQAGKGWVKFDVDPKSWPLGDYKVELRPVVEGKQWPDGPSVTYRRRTTKSNALLVSPFAPWTLERDPSRNAIAITNFLDAHQKWGKGKADDAGWKWDPDSKGNVALIAPRDHTADPVVFQLPTQGHYAVFAGVKEEGCLIQVGSRDLIRQLRVVGFDTFVAATDLTNDVIRIYSGRGSKMAKFDRVGRLTSLRFVPVTSDSVKSFYQEIGNPVVPLTAVNDWGSYFEQPGTRLFPDQFDTIVGGLAELGFRTIGWSLGRGYLEYPSKLPNVCVFPCISYEEAKKAYEANYDYEPFGMMIAKDPLGSVYRSRPRFNVEVWPWLGMQRHYGPKSYWGLLASSPFYRKNPQWWRIAKDGSDAIGMSYFFPEVRKERVDILLEATVLGADGLIIGCDRQVPMLLYNPEMVKAYRDRTGVDPLKIDASHGKPYEDWIRWRADFFTQVLRDLKKELDPIRARRAKRIPVAVRFPSAGLFFNLAQGLDVETWCREQLVDELLLDPLEDLGGKGPHDVRPYLELGRRHGIPVLGGIGATGFLSSSGPYILPGNMGTLTAGLKRALGLLRAGVDGIDTYETEIIAQVSPARFLVPLYGNPRRLEAFLKDSNMESCYPVDAGTAAAGHDNHSRWQANLPHSWNTVWDVHGFGPKSL